MKRILDPSFKYVPYDKTKEPGYLKRRFDEIRQQQKDEAANRLKNVIQRRFSK